MNFDFKTHYLQLFKGLGFDLRFAHHCHAADRDSRAVVEWHCRHSSNHVVVRVA